MAMAKLRMIDEAPAALTDKIKSMVESGASVSMLDVAITPQVAKMLLRYNAAGLGGTNRALRQKEVAHWASIMRDGQWVNTGEPIIMSDNRTLNDGQHRLAAVIQADMEVTMDIRFGVPRQAFLTTGVGKMRTGVDALMIAGYTNRLGLAGCCRMIIAYQKGLPNAARLRTRPPEVIALMDRFPDLAEALTFLNNMGKRMRVGSMQTLAFLALHSANRATVEGFFEILRTSVGVERRTAAHQLYDAIWAGNGFGNETDGRVLCLAIGIQCWNAYQANERVKSFWMPGQTFPKVAGLKL